MTLVLELLRAQNSASLFSDSLPRLARLLWTLLFTPLQLLTLSFGPDVAAKIACVIIYIVKKNCLLWALVVLEFHCNILPVLAGSVFESCWLMVVVLGSVPVPLFVVGEMEKWKLPIVWLIPLGWYCWAIAGNSQWLLLSVAAIVSGCCTAAVGMISTWLSWVGEASKAG